MTDQKPQSEDSLPPRISVYLPCHNQERFVGSAIESVLRQTVSDWELLVIDDASTDDTEEVLNLYRSNPQIQIIKTEGLGLPAVCNLALAKARGDYIIRLDGDDIFDENILHLLGHHLDRNAGLALVFPDYFLMDEIGNVFEHVRRRRLYDENHMPDMPPNGACVMVRRSVLESLQGYREDLGAQDGLDLWSKISRDHRCTNVNVPLFYYRRHESNLTRNVHRILSARRRIKRDSINDRIDQLRPLIAVIPCRRGYDFAADLWDQEIGGQKLLDRDLDACLSSDLFDRVVVACDNPEAEKRLSGRDDPRLHFHLRDAASTIRTASIVPTLEKIARDHDPTLQGITVLRYIQSPFVTATTLEEAASTLAMYEADSACGVEEIHSQLFRRSAHGLETINPTGEMSSDFDIIYRDAKTCLATRNRNLARGSLTGASVASFVVSAAECFFIGSEDDLRIAHIMAQMSAVRTPSC